MLITIESDRECTVDGVGLLEPGKPVVVDPEKFRLYHKTSPAVANFPYFIKVTVDLTNSEEVAKEDSTSEEDSSLDQDNAKEEEES